MKLCEIENIEFEFCRKCFARNDFFKNFIREKLETKIVTKLNVVTRLTAH